MRKILMIFSFLVIVGNCFAREEISNYVNFGLSGTWSKASDGNKAIYSLFGTCYWRINDYFHVGPGVSASVVTAKAKVYGGGQGSNYAAGTGGALLPYLSLKGELPTKSLVSVFLSADAGPHVWLKEKIKVNVFITSKLGVKFKLQQIDKSIYISGVYQFMPATKSQAFIGLGGICIGIEL